MRIGWTDVLAYSTYDDAPFSPLPIALKSAEFPNALPLTTGVKCNVDAYANPNATQLSPIGRPHIAPRRCSFPSIQPWRLELKSPGSGNADRPSPLAGHRTQMRAPDQIQARCAAHVSARFPQHPRKGRLLNRVTYHPQPLQHGFG
jgi:hypothetical protein